MEAKIKNLDELERRFGLHFNNRRLITTALTHRSYLNEVEGNDLEHNERLEFLGDAVLELVVTEYLYLNFSNPEGELTNWRSSIVKGEVLAKVALELDIGNYLLMSRGEEKSGGRTRGLILANAFEAIVGAIYLEFGYDAAKNFIEKQLISLLPEIIEKKLYIDPKSRLQEITQEKIGKTPEYIVIREEGPDHDKIFTVSVRVGHETLAQGEGSSKQRAEQSAAQLALKKIEN